MITAPVRATVSDTRRSRSPLQRPRPSICRNTEGGAGHDVVSRAGLGGLQLYRLDALLRQLGGHGQLLRGVVLASVTAVEQIHVHLVRADAGGVDGQLEPRRPDVGPAR